MDTFATSTKCLSLRYICLIEMESSDRCIGNLSGFWHLRAGSLALATKFPCFLDICWHSCFILVLQHCQKMRLHSLLPQYTELVFHNLYWSARWISTTFTGTEGWSIIVSVYTTQAEYLTNMQTKCLEILVSVPAAWRWIVLGPTRLIPSEIANQCMQKGYSLKWYTLKNYISR